MTMPPAPGVASLDSVIDAIPHQVIVLDVEGRVIQGNRAWRKFMLVAERSESDWQGCPYLSIFHIVADEKRGEQDERPDQVLIDVLEGRRASFTGDVRCSAGDAETSFALTVTPLSGGGGVAVHQDQATLRALGHERERFQRLVAAATDAILIVDAQSSIVYANDAARQLASTLHAGGFDALVDRAALAIAATDGLFRGDAALGAAGGAELALVQEVRQQLSSDGSPYFTVVLHDVSAERAREAELEKRNAELQQAYSRLQDAQEQLLQSEKMASIGQLAAGVAHEINNPIGYVHSNLGTLRDYARSIFSMLGAYENALSSDNASDSRRRTLDELRQRLELDYVVQDLPALLDESREGIERVRKIVQDLKDFSRVGQSENFELTDLHRGLESTLNIVWNEIKYKAELSKNYGEMPPVECLPSQINQVFLNLLVNAGDAIGERGQIRINTGAESGEAWIEIADSGHGIAEEHLAKIFDPFFTTKPVGRGTGLGLSLSYSIVKKHGGRIEVQSKLGTGTCFRIVLPLRQPA
jgi:signal transduction histidine kinase